MAHPIWLRSPSLFFLLSLSDLLLFLSLFPHVWPPPEDWPSAASRWNASAYPNRWLPMSPALGAQPLVMRALMITWRRCGLWCMMLQWRCGLMLDALWLLSIQTIAMCCSCYLTNVIFINMILEKRRWKKFVNFHMLVTSTTPHSCASMLLRICFGLRQFLLFHQFRWEVWRFFLLH